MGDILGHASRRKLLAWYRRARRDLPWRRTRDPYAVWVSEVMLQQTRVAAVLPYYERFLKRFPDVGTLSRARIDTVLAHWSGLGYYRRARHLHAAARVVAREGVPRSAAVWRRLPGVGEYTAHAIASIAFGERRPVVDGNVERVLSRMHAADLTRSEMRSAAARWLSPRAPGTHNQAVMELGATICTPRAPACPRCPVRGFCAGQGERFPTPRRRARPVDERLAVGYAVRDGRVLLRRRAREELTPGLWDLPAATTPGGDGPPLARIRHGVVNRRLEIEVYAADAAAGGGRWFTPAQLARAPLATAARKCLEAVGFL